MDEYNRTHMQVKRDVQEALRQVEMNDLMEADEVFDVLLSKYED